MNWYDWIDEWLGENSTLDSHHPTAWLSPQRRFFPRFLFSRFAFSSEASSSSSSWHLRFKTATLTSLFSLGLWPCKRKFWNPHCTTFRPCSKHMGSESVWEWTSNLDKTCNLQFRFGTGRDHDIVLLFFVLLLIIAAQRLTTKMQRQHVATVNPCSDCMMKHASRFQDVLSSLILVFQSCSLVLCVRNESFSRQGSRNTALWNGAHGAMHFQTIRFLFHCCFCWVTHRTHSYNLTRSAV